MNELVLRADRVLTPGTSVAPGWVSVRDGVVTAVGEGEPAGDATRVSGTVVPGFVDLHCHGGGGAAFTDGADAARQALAAHRAHGTTSTVASLVTDALPRLREQVVALAALVADDELLGVHLEGPWLSPLHAGAHDAGLLRAPSAEDAAALLDAAPGAVRVVTLAPELPGGLDVVRLLVERGVVAALGHSDARYDDARRAIDAGCRLGTHLFNAERGIHHREPGPVPALLGSGEVVVEVVADGVHLHPTVLAEVVRRAPGRVAAVTDATAAAGAGPGRYALGPQEIEVADGVAHLAGTDVLAGSVLTLDRALRHLVHDVGLDLAEALPLLTTTPADVLGRDDLGRLRPGARADLVVLDASLAVTRVMRRGRWLEQRPG